MPIEGGSSSDSYGDYANSEPSFSSLGTNMLKTLWKALNFSRITFKMVGGQCSF